jgi:hypothetical protein
MSRRPIEHTRPEGTIKWPPTVGPEENHELGSNGVTLVTLAILIFAALRLAFLWTSPRWLHQRFHDRC